MEHTFTIDSTDDTVIRIERDRDHVEIEFEYTDWTYYGVPDTQSAYYGGDADPETLLSEMLEELDTDPYYDDLTTKARNALRIALTELTTERSVN